MTKGKITNWALLAIGALMVLSTSALAVTQADVVRLKQKAARGEAFTPAERRLADEAREQLGSIIQWPSQEEHRRPPHSPLDVYIAADVAYEWVDITEVGTPAGLTNDDQSVGPFELGFDFTFYDQVYSSVYMTSNGWAGFQDQGGWAAYFNETIPNEAEPNAATYIFWDDLYPPTGGEYYYYEDQVNHRFIMSWINVPHIGTEDELYTFQIILTPDGNIRYNYQLVHEGGNFGNFTCTVGIENETSTEALEVCFDGTGTVPVSETSILIGQPDGVPMAVEDLAVAVNDHTVTLTWNDPTEDTNGNPVTLTNVEVWEGRPGSGDLVATVGPNVETAVLTNVLDGSKVYYVRAYANPYYGASAHIGAIVGTPSYANNFDTNDGGWTSDEGWSWGVPQNGMAPEPFSTPNAWGTDFENGFPAFADYSLVFNNDLVVANTNGVIEFYAWWRTDFGWDGCNFKASLDGGQTWEVVTPIDGYTIDAMFEGTQNPLSGEPAWTDASGGWRHIEIPLDAYIGEAPMFKFHFGSSDWAQGNPGFYLDDVIMWGLDEPVFATVSGNITFDGGNGVMTAVDVRANGFGSPSTHPAANGAYTLSNVLTGPRTITASLTGYHPRTLDLTVVEGGNTGANLTLTRLDPPPPTNVQGTVVSATGLMTLTWTAAADPLVDVYTIYRRLAGEQNFVQQGTSTTTTFQQTLTADGIYQYVVTATDNGVSVPVTSVRSNQATVLFGELPVTTLGADGDYDDRIHLSWLTPGTIEGTELFYDDGSAEQFYVVAFPAGPSDYFCVRMTPPDDATYPLLIYAATVFVEDQLDIPWIGICPPSDVFEGPDISNAMYEWTSLHADSTPGWVTCETDGSLFLEEAGDFYIVYQFPPDQNDQPAVGSDWNQVDNRSYWTQTPDQFWNLWTAHDWMMRAWLGGPPPEEGLVMNQDFYLLSTGSARGYAIDRVPTLPVVGSEDSPGRITGGDYKKALARGPVKLAGNQANPLDRWFAPYVVAPKLELVARDPRTPLDDVVNYRVYRGNTMIGEPVETDFWDLNRIENTPYSYHVTAMYDNGVESPSSPVRTLTCNMEPEAPSGLTGTPIGTSQMALAWVAPTLNRDGSALVDLAQYKVYRSGELIATLAAGTTTYTDTPPQNDGFYAWTVTAQDEVPNVSAPSVPFIGAVVSPFEAIDYEWVDISTIGTPLTFDWWGATAGPIELGFTYPFLDEEYSQIYISPSGWVSFQQVQGFWFSQPIPDGIEPHAAIYPFWDELGVFETAQVITYHDAADDRFIISWIDVPSLNDFNFRYTFQLILEEGGAAIFNYHTIPDQGWPGNMDCTVGVEDATSTSAVQVYSQGSGVIPPMSETSIAFWAGPSGTITGLIREFGSNAPLNNVRVTVDEVPDLFVNTDVTGLYVLEVEPGTYHLRTHIQGYCDQDATNVVVADDGTATRNFTMRQPNATFSVTSINILSVTGQNATAEFEITNPNGQCDLEYSITTNRTWLTVSNATGNVAANQSQTITVTGFTADFVPGDYTGTILVAHNDHNSPLTIPVSISQSLDADNNAELPTEFALHQNYPNPFNATTVLSFDVPQESQVELVLFNIQGQEVARPVDRLMAAGRHAVNFDATNLPTGMYLVKMNAGNYSAVQKMVLLK